jgi:HSP20 family protein
MKTTKKETKSFGEFPREIDSLRNNAFPGITQRGIIPLQSFNHGVPSFNPYFNGYPQQNFAGWNNNVPFANNVPGIYSFAPSFNPFQQPANYFNPQQNHQPSSNPAFLGAEEVTTLANISEDEESYIIELSVPGYKHENCKVKVKDRVLYVFGKREAEKETLFYSLKEYKNVYFERTFLISDEVDTEEIEATCVDGILTLRLPKKSEDTLQEKEIEISEEEFA